MPAAADYYKAVYTLAIDNGQLYLLSYIAIDRESHNLVLTRTFQTHSIRSTDGILTMWSRFAVSGYRYFLEILNRSRHRILSDNTV